MAGQLATTHDDGGAVDEDGIDYDAIVTEDDTPVDSVYAERQHRVLCEALDSGWEGPPHPEGVAVPFVTMTNVGMFDAPDRPPLVPDMLLSLNVQLPSDGQPKKNRSYFIWRYGKAPEVVVEVVSNREGGEFTVRKRRLAEMGVAFYVVWDPWKFLSKTPLQAFKLAGKSYRRMARPHFPSLGLALIPWEGSIRGFKSRWLRWCDTHGVLIPTADEARARGTHRARDAEARAEAETARAEAETARAEAETARAEQLAAKLRALGIDPDAL